MPITTSSTLYEHTKPAIGLPRAVSKIWELTKSPWLQCDSLCWTKASRLIMIGNNQSLGAAELGRWRAWTSSIYIRFTVLLPKARAGMKHSLIDYCQVVRNLYAVRGRVSKSWQPSCFPFSGCIYTKVAVSVLSRKGHNTQCIGRNKKIRIKKIV